MSAAWAGGHCVEADGRALPQRPVKGVAQVEERTERGGAAGARGGMALDPAHGHQMHELGNIDVMRLDQTLGQPRHVACASGCISIRTSLEEGIKLHRFAGMFPEQFFTETGRHREAVVAADQRMVIRSYGDDIAGFVHDVSHAHPTFGGSRAETVDLDRWCGEYCILHPLEMTFSVATSTIYGSEL